MANWMGAIRSAINAFWLTLNQADGDTPLAVDIAGWSEYKMRLQRYALYEAYDSNVVYREVYKASNARKVKYKLYKHIRGIYNPFHRATMTFGSFVYGGKLDRELRSGSIPLVTDNDALRAAVWQIFKWSAWGTNKGLYAINGAKFGDSPIKIVDDPARKQVRLELVDPAKIKDLKLDPVGNVKGVVIEYDRIDPENEPPLGENDNRPAKTARYTEIAEHGGRMRLFRNDDPYEWDGLPSEWDNDYDFVPLVVAYHSPPTMGWGKNALHGVLDKIDEINDQASNINDILRKHNHPIWLFTGINGASDIDLSNATGRKDGLPYISLGKNTDAKPMVAPISLADADHNLGRMLDELERDLPILSLSRLRERSGDTSAPSAEAMFSDGIASVKDARGMYDDALIRALSMAVTIGAIRRYPGFEQFSENSYQRGDLDMHIDDRPVLNDQLSKSDKVTAIMSASSAPAPYQRLILDELGYPAETVEQVVAEARLEKDTAARAAVRGLTDSLFGAQPDDTEDEDGETEDQTADENPGIAPGSAGTGDTGDRPTAD